MSLSWAMRPAWGRPYTLSNGNHGPSIAEFNVVLDLGCGGYVFFKDIHEFGFLHGGAEIVVLDVAGAPVGILGYNSVEEACEEFHGSS